MGIDWAVVPRIPWVRQFLSFGGEEKKVEEGGVPREGLQLVRFCRDFSLVEFSWPSW